jgi:hypothetical protein
MVTRVERAFGLPPGFCPAFVRFCLVSRDRREERRLESRRQAESLAPQARAAARQMLPCDRMNEPRP